MYNLSLELENLPNENPLFCAKHAVAYAANSNFGG